MTKKEVRDVAQAVKAYQMTSAANVTPRAVELPKGFVVKPDDVWTDELLHQANTEKHDAGEARKEMLRLSEKLLVMRARAEGVGAVRYDKDRVSGGLPYTVAEQVADIIEVEQELNQARMVFQLALQSFINLMYDAGFNDITVRVWVLRYVYENSIGGIAFLMRMPKWKVQYELERVSNNRDFCLALEKIIENANYEEYYEEV